MEIRGKIEIQFHGMTDPEGLNLTMKFVEDSGQEHELGQFFPVVDGAAVQFSPVLLQIAGEFGTVEPVKTSAAPEKPKDAKPVAPGGAHPTAPAHGSPPKK